MYLELRTFIRTINNFSIKLFDFFIKVLLQNKWYPFNNKPQIMHHPHSTKKPCITTIMECENISQNNKLDIKCVKKCCNFISIKLRHQKRKKYTYDKLLLWHLFYTYNMCQEVNKGNRHITLSRYSNYF